MENYLESLMANLGDEEFWNTFLEFCPPLVVENGPYCVQSQISLFPDREREEDGEELLPLKKRAKPFVPQEQVQEVQIRCSPEGLFAWRLVEQPKKTQRRTYGKENRTLSPSPFILIFTAPNQEKITGTVRVLLKDAHTGLPHQVEVNSGSTFNGAQCAISISAFASSRKSEFFLEFHLDYYIDSHLHSQVVTTEKFKIFSHTKFMKRQASPPLLSP